MQLTPEGVSNTGCAGVREAT